MSTGFSYEMDLLSVRGPGGGMHYAHSIGGRASASPPSIPSQEEARSASLSPPHSYCAIATPRRAVDPLVEGLIALRTGAVTEMARQQSGHRSAPQGDSLPRALSPPSALQPHGLFATRRILLFGLDNAAMSLTKTIHPSADTHVERPLAFPCSIVMRQEAPSSAESLGFL